MHYTRTDDTCVKLAKKVIFVFTENGMLTETIKIIEKFEKDKTEYPKLSGN